jgi:error-prone DNA polymerase
MAAVISNGGGFYSTMAYVSEAKRMGLKILTVDVNESQIHYVGEDGGIRVGLMQIKGLSDEAKHNIVSARRNYLFRGLDDMIRRADLKPSDVRQLILAGACDRLEPMLTRPEMIWHTTTRNQSHKQTKQAELFLTAPPKPPQVPEYSAKTLLHMEMETLGFLISRHPLELYRDSISPRRVTPANRMSERVGQFVQMVGWMVTAKAVVTNVRTVGWEIIGAEDESKPQELMEFVTFEDLTGLIETVIFPKVYQRFGHMLNNSRPYRLFGKVEEDFGAVTLTVNRIQYL